VTTTTDELVGYAEAAQIVGVSVATLRSYRYKGLLPDVDDASFPDRPRWRRSTIEAWLTTRPGRGGPGRKRSQT
jgi:predicted DNA-binding transcriptional regulator AlpA